jgi:hypothetical protein
MKNVFTTFDSCTNTGKIYLNNKKADSETLASAEETAPFTGGVVSAKRSSPISEPPGRKKIQSFAVLKSPAEAQTVIFYRKSLRIRFFSVSLFQTSKNI